MVRVLSPDQTMLAFTVQKDSDGDSFWDRNSIYVYNLVTQDFQVLVADHYFGIGGLSWVPDNEALIYGVDKTVWKVSLTDLAPTPLMDEFPKHIGFLNWSPDGNFLAIHLNDSSGRIVFFDTSTDLMKEVMTDQLTSPTSMFWSPDSKWFVSNKLVDRGILVVSLDEYEIVFLDDYAFNKPSWSPDSSHLAYLHRTEQQTSLFMLETSTMTTTLLFEGEHIGNPIWSVNGQDLAVTCVCNNLNTLSLIDTTTLNVTQLLTGKDLQANELLAWSPDGEWLLFWGIQDGLSGLYIVHRDGNETQLLLEMPVNTRSPEQILWLADQ